MFRKTLWILILVISIITTCIFATGVFSSLAITTGNGKTTAESATEIPLKETPSTPNIASTDYNILVIGDSLAKGTGDEKGLGYANYFAALWKKKINKEVKVNNLAINGLKSSELLATIKTDQGKAALKNSNFVFISIGGNDVREFKTSELPAVSTKVNEVENNYITNLKSVIKFVRNENKSAPIVFLGLYNPFDKDLTPDKLKLLNNWNYETEKLMSEDINGVFVPTYDLFKYNFQKYISVDRLHPNSAGHEAIANRFFEALKNY